MTLLRAVIRSRWTPGLLALAGAILALTLTGVSPSATARFAAAIAWSVLLPGILVHRAVRGRSASLLAELTAGGITGLVAQLLAWAAFVAVGLGDWLIVYPLGILTAYVAVPRLRGHLRPTTYPGRMSRTGAWGLLAVYLLSLTRLAATVLHRMPLPPAGGAWQPDAYWQLSINAEARRAVPPEVPQVAGETLRYHWLSSAHAAADSLVSGLDIVLVSGRLWYLPVHALALAATYLLAVHLTRRPAAGVAALALLIAPAALSPITWFSGVGVDALSGGSPTELFGHVFMLGTAFLLIEAVRGRLPARSWPLLALLLLGCAGSKVSILPALLGGLVLALIVVWRDDRRRRSAAAALTLCAAVLAATALLFGGGGGGSQLGLAATAVRMPAYLAPERAGAGALALVLIAAVVVLLLALQHSLIVVIAALDRATWRDPALWFLIGSFVAGFVAINLIGHPSSSQVYFLRGTRPLWAIATAWGLSALFPAGSWRAMNARRVALAAAAGVAGWGALRLAAGGSSSVSGAELRLCLCAAVLLVVTAGVLLTIRRRREVGRLVTVALLGACVIPTGIVTSNGTIDAIGSPGSRKVLGTGAVAATTWLREHTPEDDVIATNVHCRSQVTTPFCDARAFWVTGLGARRAYVESWGYTDQARAAHGVGGRSYVNQPFDDRERLQRNDIAFTEPSPAALQRLYDAGVRWLVADDRAGPVASELPQLAELRFRSGSVTIYELHGP